MPRSPLPATVASLLLLLLPAGLGAGTAGADDPGPSEVDRLVGLCRAWTAARFLHPGLLSRSSDEPLDWDRAFAEAVPPTRSARSAAEYREAVATLFAELDDPATEVVFEGAESPDDRSREKSADPGPPADGPPPLFRRVADGVVLLDVAGFREATSGYQLLARVWYSHLHEELDGARALIVDLRSPSAAPAGAGEDAELSRLAVEGIAEALAPRKLTPPVFRWPVHWGYTDRTGPASGSYESAFAHSLPRTIVPSDPDRAPERTVFLADRRTRFAGIAVALREAGDARIVGEAPLSDAQLAERVEVDLGEGLTARIRATQLVPSRVPFGADRVVEPADGEGDPALDAALALLALSEESWSASAPASESPALPPGRLPPERLYADDALPDLPGRMLSACKLWGTIEHFYPYLHLIGDWEGAYRAAIPELLAARTEEAYVRAVLHLAAAIEDDHTFVQGPGVWKVLGSMPPPLRLREIEGRWVITEVYDPAVDDLRVGDVLHAADGVPMDERIAALRSLVTASTEASRRHRAAVFSLWGDAGETLTLTVSGADGVRRTVDIRRRRLDRPPETESAPPFRILEREDPTDPALGYVDLTRLQSSQVDALFEELGATDGIVFDLRGYPHGTGAKIAARLNTRGAEVLARFRRREVSRKSFHSPDAGYFFAQRLPPPDGPLYRGEVVVLIDERAISQAEHTALALEAATDAVFVGSPTAGANGDVTTALLPGNLELTFTGHDVRHADGRQLQRVGIQPDVEAAPTLAGLRAGLDEVLDKGVEVLRRRVYSMTGSGGSGRHQRRPGGR